MDMEKRQQSRYRVRLPVGISGDLLDGRGLIVNLSSGGCAVQSDCHINGRSYVHLHFDLPHGADPIKVELAVVRWIKGRQIGLEFIRVSPAQQQRLRELIKFLDMAPDSKLAGSAASRAY